MARPATLAFERTQSAGGAVLALALLAALTAANSRWAGSYGRLISLPIPVRVGGWAQTLSLAEWARSGLMTAFFLVVGLQLKFEVLRGEFSSARRLAAPLLAAAGAVLAPAAVVLALDPSGAGLARFPATAPIDMALGLAVAGLAAPRLPRAVRLFLLTVALADDAAGAAWTTLISHHALHRNATGVLLIALGSLAALSRWRRAPRLFYAAGFVAAWGASLAAGLDPALVAVACALTVPIDPRRPDQESLLAAFLEGLHPYVALVALPLFVFTAAGAPVTRAAFAHLREPAALGVLMALAIAKPLGAYAACAGGVALRLARRPLDVQWIELAGASLLCGVGLSVSLYVAGAGTPAPDRDALRLAIVLGSLAAAAGGWLVLAWAQARRASAGPTLGDG